MEVLALCPRLSGLPRTAVQEAFPPYPRGPWLRFELCCLDPSLLTMTPCANLAGTLRLHAFALIRNAFAVRERLGDPRDLPYFRCCSFYACHRPYPGGSADSFPVKQPAVPGFLALGPSRHPPRSVSASNLRRGVRFRGCIVRFMLRPAYLPSPPDWLRQDEVTCSSPRLLRTLSLPLSHCSFPSNVGNQAKWSNGKSPIVGTFTQPVSAASEAAHQSGT